MDKRWSLGEETKTFLVIYKYVTVKGNQTLAVSKSSP